MITSIIYVWTYEIYGHSICFEHKQIEDLYQTQIAFKVIDIYLDKYSISMEKAQFDNFI